MSIKWNPISELELYDEIQKTERDLNGELWNFWQLIQISPVKWRERTFGEEGGGFWVVAICGKVIIWYNDIEDGFNISTYDELGRINEYYCNQDALSWAVERLFAIIKHGGKLTGHAGPPEPLN